MVTKKVDRNYLWVLIVAEIELLKVKPESITMVSLIIHIYQIAP